MVAPIANEPREDDRREQDGMSVQEACDRAQGHRLVIGVEEDRESALGGRWQGHLLAA